MSNGEDMKILVRIDNTTTKEELDKLKEEVEKETPEPAKAKLLDRISLKRKKVEEGR